MKTPIIRWIAQGAPGPTRFRTWIDFAVLLMLPSPPRQTAQIDAKPMEALGLGKDFVSQPLGGKCHDQAMHLQAGYEIGGCRSQTAIAGEVLETAGRERELSGKELESAMH